MSGDNTYQSGGTSVAYSGHIDRGEGYDVAIVEAVADAVDSDPYDLDVVLQEVIDVDALERLVASQGTDGAAAGRVTFSYYGYEVTVTTDRMLVLRD